MKWYLATTIQQTYKKTETSSETTSSTSPNSVTGTWLNYVYDDYTGEGRIIGAYAGQEIQE